MTIEHPQSVAPKSLDATERKDGNSRGQGVNLAAPGNDHAEKTLAEEYAEDSLTAMQAKEYAQYIAFGPSVFQAARTLCATGVLAALEEARPVGLTLQETMGRTGLSEYGARVLLEAGLGIGLVLVREGRYLPTKTAHFLLHDPLTKVNMDFTHEVTYLGLFDLEHAIRNGVPSGLKRLGQGSTVYRALAHLPERVRRAWFAFDQYYSDSAFPAVLPLVFKHRPRKLLDVGGNTGKWALACLRHDAKVEVTLADLPGQLVMAKENISSQGFAARTQFVEMDLLDGDAYFPDTFDTIWLSQFLDCFSEDEIVSILSRCRRALEPDGRIFILETFWDRQRYPVAAFCLQQTSLYFTAIANGNSQMYAADVFLRHVAKAGLKVEEQRDHLGVSHTLLMCRPS